MRTDSINWHSELTKRGFKLVETTTRTYSYRGGWTGSVVYENDKGKITDDGTREVFCPFLPGEDYQTLRIYTVNELDRFCF